MRGYDSRVKPSNAIPDSKQKPVFEILDAPQDIYAHGSTVHLTGLILHD
jgi:hypothetical protein